MATEAKHKVRIHGEETEVTTMSLALNPSTQARGTSLLSPAGVREWLKKADVRNLLGPWPSVPNDVETLRLAVLACEKAIAQVTAEIRRNQATAVAPNAKFSEERETRLGRASSELSADIRRLTSLRDIFEEALNPPELRKRDTSKKALEAELTAVDARRRTRLRLNLSPVNQRLGSFDQIAQLRQ